MQRFTWTAHVTFVVTILAVTTTPAQTTTNYQIFPQFSTLNRTGGFAGVDEDYLLTGEFDFTPQLSGSAQFEMATIYGSLISDGPAITIVQPIHDRLDIENLEGELLPTAGPFDIFQFQGETFDGSNLVLNATISGPWIFVAGESTPPQGGTDFFNYEIQLLARNGAFADPNNDGTVDAADFTRYQDLNDDAGLELWQSQFGESVPDFGIVDSPANTMVPEPDAAILGAACLLFFFCVGRCRNRHQAR